MSKVCEGLDCGKRGEELKRCGRCRMVWYCSVQCQRKAWPTHGKECKRDELDEPGTKFEAVVRSGQSARLAKAVATADPEWDKRVLRRGISSGAYSDTQIVLGHGVKLAMRGEDGYWVQLEKNGEWVPLGKIVGIKATADALDQLMRKHNKPIDGMAAVHKLMSAVMRVMNNAPPEKK